LSFNPGYAGAEGKFCSTVMFREQWAGFGGQPRSILFNFHAPVPILYGGAGLTIFSDKLGFQSNTVARASYSFHRYINNIGTIGIGLQAGIISVGYSPTWVSIDPVDQDNAIPDNGVSQVTYDLGLGVYLKGNGYYAGISTTHITQSELQNVNYSNRRHYQIMGGYTWVMPFANGDFALDPSLLVKSDATSTQLDINVRCTWKTMVWLGVGYRVKDGNIPSRLIQKEQVRAPFV
jgi:type IX secretion system PorP/SprF family membrane protein